MKKNFIFLCSAMMLCACGGSKTQDNASEEQTVTEAEATANDASQELRWGFVSVDDDHLGSIDGCDREEFYMAQEFLGDVVMTDEVDETFTEEWITAHCTPEVKQFLREKYAYDGEGYAKWLMEGRFDGEGEYEIEVLGFGYGERHGKPVYNVEMHFSFEGMESFVRTLYFGLQRQGDDFVITSFEVNLASDDPTLSELPHHYDE